MHLNIRSTIVLLLLAFGVGAFGCVESTEQTDDLATIPQEIVLFSAKPGIDSAAISYGYSKTGGWQLQRYADLQTATDLSGDTLQVREQEMNFSGSAAQRGRFSGSVIGSTSVRGQQYGASFSGGTQAYHSFQGKIAGGTGLSCSIYLICDFVDAICDSVQDQTGGIKGCKNGAQKCRDAVSQGMGSMTPKEEAQFCAVFDSILSGNFQFDVSVDVD